MGRSSTALVQIQHLTLFTLTSITLTDLVLIFTQKLRANLKLTFKENSPQILLHSLCHLAHSRNYFGMKCCNLLFGVSSFAPVTLSSSDSLTDLLYCIHHTTLQQPAWTSLTAAVSFYSWKTWELQPRGVLRTIFLILLYCLTCLIPEEDISWGDGN